MRSKESWEYQYRMKASAWRDVTRDLPKELKGKRVLEVGCGNGKTSAGILLQNVKELVGIDFSKSAVKQCQKRFDGKKNAVFLESDVLDMPFEKESFDAVVCYHTLGHLLKKERTNAVNEMKRVLVKEGRLYFEDFGKGDLRETKGKTVEKGTVERGNGITYHYFTKTELQTLFKSWKKVELAEKKIELKMGKEKVVRAEWKGVWGK